MLQKPTAENYKKYIAESMFGPTGRDRTAEKEKCMARYQKRYLQRIIDDTFLFVDHLLFDAKWSQQITTNHLPSGDFFCKYDSENLYVDEEIYDSENLYVDEEIDDLKIIEFSDYIYTMSINKKEMRVSDLFLKELFGFGLHKEVKRFDIYNEEEEAGHIEFIGEMEVKSSKEHLYNLKQEFLPFHEEIMEKKRQTEREKILVQRQIDEQNGQPWLYLEL